MNFSEALTYFRSIGKQVAPSDVPGLTVVDVRHATSIQVDDVVNAISYEIVPPFGE